MSPNILQKFTFSQNTAIAAGFIFAVIGVAVIFIFRKKFGGAYTSARFEKCLFKFVIAHFTKRRGVWPDYGAIKQTLDRLSPGQREREAARIYFQIEDTILEDRKKQKIERDDVRAKIFSACKAQKAGGILPIIFLPEHLQLSRLHQHFANTLFFRAHAALSADAFSKIITSIDRGKYPKNFISDGGFAWTVFEAQMAELDYEHQLEEIKHLVKQFAAKVLQYAIADAGNDRASAIFSDAYHDFKNTHLFIGIERVADVLRIVPEGILSSERIAILPKADLEEAVRSRTEELERALEKVEAQRKELDRAYEDLRQNDVLKTEFIDVISHQFRTPLSVIRWQTELLMDEVMKYVLPEKTGEFHENIQTLYQKSVFLIELLNDLFDVLAIEGKKLILNKQPYPLWEIASDACKEFERDAAKKSITLSLSKRAPVFREAAVDRDKIRRVFDILIRNALRYTPEKGTVTVDVEETVVHDKPAIACSVQDTGIGIEREDVSKIFGRFFRAQNAIRTAPDGAGLGLYLTKQFIAAHNGTIEVFSEAGKGTRFTFVIPAE